MQVSSKDAGSKQHKAAYFLGIAAAVLVFALSIEDPKIHGLDFWAISFCAALALVVSVVKLRNLWRGTGWVFPATNNILLWAVVIAIWLHLWFSH